MKVNTSHAIFIVLNINTRGAELPVVNKHEERFMHIVVGILEKKKSLGKKESDLAWPSLPCHTFL